MKNLKVLMTIIILLSVAALVTQSALAKEESISIARASLKTPTNETELVSFVESAVAL